MSTVLVVDDEPDVRLVARMILENAGHDVIEVDSGQAALDELEIGGAPDVILLDVRMPGIDGWEVLRRLRGSPGRYADLPVVVFTADMSERHNAPSVLAEGDFFLAKPFAPQQLVETIETAVAGAQAGATRP